MTVYALTAPPGLTWAHDSADGGDLITAALTLGTPHPSGYPTWTLLAALFSRLPMGEPAWRATLLSMVSAATASALTAAATPWLTRLAEVATPHSTAERMGLRSSPPAVLLLSTTPALVAGLALAFSPLLWGQAIVAEVYALHAALAAAALWALVRRQAGGSDRWALAAGCFLGLGLGNHLTTLWLLPAAVLLLWTAGASAAGRRRAFAAGGAGLAAALLVYLYLPWAASGTAPVNWAAPGSVDRLWWLASGELYRGYVFALPWPAAPGRLAAWSGQLWRGLMPWGLAASLLGLVILFQRQRALAIALSSSLLLGLIWAVGYNTSDSLLTLLPGWVILALAAGVGVAALLAGLASWRPRVALAAALACLVLVAAPAAIRWQQQTLRHDRAAEEFYSQVLQHVAEDAVVLTVGDRATFALWYGRYGLALRPDIAPLSRDLWALPSYRTLVASQHPDLAGPAPPADWQELLAQIGQRQPLYLAQAGQTEGNQPPVVAGWQPALALMGEGWNLWRLEIDPNCGPRHLPEPSPCGSLRSDD
jgi:hypothetical protein